MREIDVSEITEAVAAGLIKANLYLPCELGEKINTARENETNPLAKSLFDDMIKNLEAADKKQIPICQDCGMAVIFAEIGQDVHFVGGDFNEAVNKGVAKGYTEGYLRKSVVRDPIRRGNTGDNTPAVLHVSIVPGENVKLTMAPKGFGSENMSVLKMFNPTASQESIIDFIVDAVAKADAKPCPPVVIGVGIGGDFEYSACLAKKALCRATDSENADPYYAEMEKTITRKINGLGIGPQGFGGDTTCLACGIEAYPTHIAGLPVAVNIGCHVTRHCEITL